MMIEPPIDELAAKIDNNKYKLCVVMSKRAKELEKRIPEELEKSDKKAISLADIKDEEMMAAALVATIDYHEETKEDVRVVSIKEIK